MNIYGIDNAAKTLGVSRHVIAHLLRKSAGQLWHPPKKKAPKNNANSYFWTDEYDLRLWFAISRHGTPDNPVHGTRYAGELLGDVPQQIISEVIAELRIKKPSKVPALSAPLLNANNKQYRAYVWSSPQALLEWWSEVQEYTPSQPSLKLLTGQEQEEARRRTEATVQASFQKIDDLHKQLEPVFSLAGKTISREELLELVIDTGIEIYLYRLSNALGSLPQSVSDIKPKEDAPKSRRRRNRYRDRVKP